LGEKTMADKAFLDALDAHLIVLPGRRTQALAPWLVDWLDHWAAHRQIRAAALGVPNDGPAAELGSRPFPEMKQLARRNGLNLILDSKCTVHGTSEHLVRSLVEHAMTKPINQLARVNFTVPDPCLAWGIND
jgi:hypothetical protein